MYATIRIYADAEGLADAVAEHKAESWVLFREVGGFRNYHIVKTGPKSAASITVYDDQAGVEASSRIARDWIAANLAGLSIAPQVLVGEVAMSASTAAGSRNCRSATSSAAGARPATAIAWRS